MSKIPDKKHSDKELSELRARSAMQSANSPIVETYNKKLADRGVVIIGYMLPLTGPLWAFVKAATKDTNYTMSDFYIMAVPIVIGLIIALWIALKRVLSRHNSAFILIISLFSCFAILHGANTDKTFKHKLMSLIGKEPAMPQTDPLLDSGMDDMDSDEIGEQLRKERERIRRENSGVEPDGVAPENTER